MLTDYLSRTDIPVCPSFITIVSLVFCLDCIDPPLPLERAAERGFTFGYDPSPRSLPKGKGMK